MNNLLNTLLEEKEKLDKLYQMEEQHRKRIHENLDTLTIDQIKEMSLEDKILLRETFLLSIDDMKIREALYIEIRRGLIKENGAAIHYPFLNELTFLTKEQIYEFDGFVARMRNLNALYKDLAETEFNNTSQEVAEYDNTEYKTMELTDDQWKQIIDMLVEHKVGKCMLKISACASGDTCWIDQTEYEKVRSGNASEEEKEEIRSQVEEYRKFAPLIQTGLYYRLSDPSKEEYAAWAFVSEDQKEVLLNVVMQEIHGNMTVNYVNLQGLKCSAVYRDTETGKTYNGAALMEAGIPMPVEMGEFKAYQMHLVGEE